MRGKDGAITLVRVMSTFRNRTMMSSVGSSFSYRGVLLFMSLRTLMGLV